MKSLTLNREYLLGKKVKISSLSDFHIVAGKCCLLGLEMATWDNCGYTPKRNYGIFIGKQGSLLCVSEYGWEEDEDDLPDYCGLEEISISLFKEQTPVNKTKRTKVEYVKCDMSLSEIAKAMIDGGIFYDKDGLNSYAWSGYRFEVNNGGAIEIRGDFYQRTKVEIDWCDEVVDTIGSGLLKRHGEGFQIGGVFVSSEEMVKIAQTVLNCRGE